MSLKAATSNPRNHTNYHTDIRVRTLKLCICGLWHRVAARQRKRARDTETWETQNKSGHRRKKKHYVQEWPSTALENGRTSRETLSSIHFSPLAPTLISRYFSPTLPLYIHVHLRSMYVGLHSWFS
jgi:hypothetical protein